MLACGWGRYYPVARCLPSWTIFHLWISTRTNAVILPASATRHLFWPCFARMLIRAPAAQVNESTASALRAVFCSTRLCCCRGELSAKIIEYWKTQQQLFAWLLAGVALISVVVAAVG